MVEGCMEGVEGEGDGVSKIVGWEPLHSRSANQVAGGSVIELIQKQSSSEKEEAMRFIYIIYVI